MTRRGVVLCLAALLLLAGCLLASCGEAAETQPPQEGSAAVSIEEPATEEPSTEDPSTEETTSETSSLPEEPAEPTETLYYLPTEGILHNRNTDAAADNDPQDCYTFTYGEDTLEITKRYANGDVFRYQYRFDERGQVTERVWEVTTSGGASTETQTYAYDGAGRLTGITTDSGPNGITGFVTYTYDGAGRLLRWESKDVYANGFTAIDAIDYLRSFDESGLLTRMEARQLHGGYTERLYEDGREVLRNVYDEDGSLTDVFAFAYDESGRLTRERARQGSFVWADAYFYDGDRLAEVRRDEGAGAQTHRMYEYDERGRLTAARQYTRFNSLSYGENGNLCRVDSFNVTAEGELFPMETREVTAWGDEAATELQLAFYRVAMAEFFNGAGTGTEQFYTVLLPEP